MGVRVYELARTLGRSSKDLMHELKKQGIDLKSHMSSIDEETAELVADLLKALPPPSVCWWARGAASATRAFRARRRPRWT